MFILFPFNPVLDKAQNSTTSYTFWFINTNFGKSIQIFQLNRKGQNVNSLIISAKVYIRTNIVEFNLFSFHLSSTSHFLCLSRYFPFTIFTILVFGICAKITSLGTTLVICMCLVYNIYTLQRIMIIF